MKIKNREEAKQVVKDSLLDVKNMVHDVNAIAEKFQVFPKDPTIILNLSCQCDELIGKIDEENEERSKKR